MALSPKLPAEFFDKNNEVTFELFNEVLVVYHNEKRLNCYEGVNLRYTVNGKTYDNLSGDIAIKIRNKEIKRIDVEIY